MTKNRQKFKNQLIQVKRLQNSVLQKRLMLNHKFQSTSYFKKLKKIKLLKKI